MKKLAIPLAILLMLATPITAFADEGDAPETEASPSLSDEIMVLDDWTAPLPDDAEGAEPDYAVTGDEIYPVSVEEKRVNGRNVIVKVYELPQGFDPEQLVEEDFELDGHIYSRSEILKSELAGEVESKLAYTTVSVRTDNGKDSEIMAFLAPLMDYADDGFTGQLELDYGSITTSVEGTTSYSYAVQERKEYTGLDSNDLSYIPKTITGRNGQTLQLTDVNWTPLGGTMRGDVMLPAAYSASALYCGTASGSSATGYISTATYKGVISRKIPGNVQYTIMYEGEKIPTNWGKYVLTGFLCLVAIGLIVVICIFGRRFIKEMIARHNRKVMEQKRAESRKAGEYHEV